MSAPEAAAAILWIGATLYAVFGGADFGAGMIELSARGRRGLRAKQVIDRSLTPVWEANHVWLIFCLVMLWTGFPEAFAAIMTTLYIPLCLAAVGIVLRGAGFAFRKMIEEPNLRRRASAVFALSSVMTPFFMGTVVGAIACGRVPAAGNGDLITSWLAPGPIAVGILFVATCAYLAAIFLVVDAGKPDRGGPSMSAEAGTATGPAPETAELQSYFARRALVAALIAGLAAVLGLVALESDGHYVFDRLFGPALPLVVLSGLGGLGVVALLLHALRTGRVTAAPLRPLAVGAVIGVVWAWAVAQHPYLLPTELTVEAAAAPSATLTALFIVFAVAVAVILPALDLLYILTQRQALSE